MKTPSMLTTTVGVVAATSAAAPGFAPYGFQSGDFGQPSSSELLDDDAYASSMYYDAKASGAGVPKPESLEEDGGLSPRAEAQAEAPGRRQDEGCGIKDSPSRRLRTGGGLQPGRKFSPSGRLYSLADHAPWHVSIENTLCRLNELRVEKQLLTREVGATHPVF